jgi:hypothetical protein
LIKADQRSSKSVGGSLEAKVAREGPYFSADMTASTDYHPFWLTRSLYEELAARDERLEKYVKYFDVLFGPRVVIKWWSSPPGTFDNIRFAPRPPVTFAPEPDWVFERKSVRGIFPKEFTAAAQDYVNAYDSWLISLERFALGEESYPGVVTTTGAMMGDPTSFPLLPLVSSYAAEMAGHPRWEGAHCGDDALYGKAGDGFPERWKFYARSLGGVPQDQKSFEHPFLGLFTEAPYENGIRKEFTVLSNWVAPPGGSKGEINWATQPLTCVQQSVAQGRSKRYGLWKFSPLWQMHRLAYQMGLPIGAPEDMGGLGHPMFPKASTTDHLSWLSYLSGLNQYELTFGTGLSLIRSPHQLMRRKASKEVERLAVDRDKEIIYQQFVNMSQPGEFPYIPRRLITDEPLGRDGKPHLTLTELSDLFSSPLITWEFFWRSPIVADKTPSIRTAVRRFQQRVGHSPAISGRYANVVAELERKRSKFASPEFVQLATSSRTQLSYGLEYAPAEKVSKEHWIPGRMAWD